jgi:hypothetical protein
MEQPENTMSRVEGKVEELEQSDKDKEKNTKKVLMEHAKSLRNIKISEL